LYVIPDWRLRVAGVSAWFQLDRGRGLLFEDTRGLGSMTVHDATGLRKLLNKLWPEPLSPQFTAQALTKSAAGVGQRAQLLLMDQRRVAGIGKSYAAEELFEAAISPLSPIGVVDRQRMTSFRDDIVRVLRDARKSAHQAYTRPGRFQEAESFQLAV